MSTTEMTGHSTASSTRNSDTISNTPNSDSVSSNTGNNNNTMTVSLPIFIFVVCFAFLSCICLSIVCGFMGYWHKQAKYYKNETINMSNKHSIVMTDGTGSNHVKATEDKLPQNMGTIRTNHVDEDVNDMKYIADTVGENKNNNQLQDIDSNALNIVLSEFTDNGACLPASIDIQDTAMNNGESDSDESVDENDLACGVTEGKQ